MKRGSSYCLITFTRFSQICLERESKVEYLCFSLTHYIRLVENIRRGSKSYGHLSLQEAQEAQDVLCNYPGLSRFPALTCHHISLWWLHHWLLCSCIFHQIYLIWVAWGLKVTQAPPGLCCPVNIKHFTAIWTKNKMKEHVGWHPSFVCLVGPPDHSDRSSLIR